MNRQLPAKASIENLKNQAKLLLRTLKNCDAEAAQRFRNTRPDLRDASDEEIFASAPGLQHTQAVIAREYGFKSWTHLKQRLAPSAALPPWKELRNAIDADDKAKVARIIAKNPEVLNEALHEGEDGYFNQRHTALPYAVQGGRVQVVRYLADNFPHLVHLPDHHGRTPINTLGHVMATACAGLTPPRQEIYQLLKSRGDKPDLGNAAKAADLDQVRLLLSEGADPYAPGQGRLTDGPAFVIAADAGHAEVVRILLDHAQPTAKSAFDALSRALLVNHWDVIRLIQPFVPTERLSECLGGCCEFLNLEGVEFLLQHGANPNIQIDPKEPRSFPLLIALDTYSRKPWRSRVIETLIKAGATQWEPSPQMTIHRGRPDLLRDFLKADPSLARRTFSGPINRAGTLHGGTLLHLAVEYYELECVRLLLDLGADINARSAIDESGIGGATSIFLVTPSYKHHGLDVLRELIQRGARLDIEANLSHTRAGATQPETRRVTPLGRARWIGADWPDDNAEREIRLLREAGAPE
jgi:hypothetical protein